MGAAPMPDPVLNCQRRLPVLASSALNQPRTSPRKTRPPAALAVLDLPGEFAVLGVERFDPAAHVAVEDEPARRRHGASEPGQGVLVAPHLLLLDPIPRHELR